jgi:hypothetical protein
MLVAFVAVLGIAVAAAITWRTSQLVRQRIGLASEPLTAGQRLLPPVTSTPTQATRTSTHPPSSTTAPSQTRSSPKSSTTSPSTTPSPTPSTTSPTVAPSTTAPSGTQSAPAPEGVPTESPLPGSGGRKDGGGDASSHRDD